MNIQNRLSRIEAAMQTSQPDPADQAYLDYHLAIIEIIYGTDDETERQEKIAALGPRPEPVTESSRAFERALEKAYGEAQPMEAV